MTLICSILSRAIHQMRCSLLVRSAESFCLNFFLPFLIKVPYRCRQLERHSCGLVNPWWSSWVLPSCERECAFHLKKFVVARQRMLSVLQRIETHKMSCIKCHKKPEPLDWSSQLDRNSEFLVLRLLTLYMNSHSNHVQRFHEYTSNISVNNITA